MNVSSLTCARERTASPSGTEKKVSIVCALQHSPELCIFDEPTSGLDPLIQKEFFEILKERNVQGTTIFLSSHILSEVQKYCSRAAVIREGQIAACGDITELSGTNARRVTLTDADTMAVQLLLDEMTETNKILDTKHSNIRDFHTTDNSVSFLFQGNIKELMDRLTQISYTDISVTEPDLSEIFMHFYE